MAWQETTLGGAIELFDNKRVPLNAQQRASRQGQFPYYGAQGIIDWIDDYIYEGRYLLVPEDGENLRSRKAPIAFFASGRFWVNNHAHVLRGRQGIADDVFLKHWLNNADVSGFITGAAQPKLSQDGLRRITIKLPDIFTQRRIASILSAYDDLIENNTRRIAILEEMARRIYEEWFVHFRFPGHEQVKMVESELGLIPEGWSVCRLDHVLVLQRGFDLPRQDRTEGCFPIISASGQSGTHQEFRVRGPGVVTGRSGSLGAVMYVESDFWPLNTTLWVKEFKVGSALYAFYVLKSIDLAGFNSGAAVPTLNRNDIHGLSVLKPVPGVLDHFDTTVGPMLALKRRLEKKSANLRTTRDLLLPKLISGELDVSTLPESGEAIAA